MRLCEGFCCITWHCLRIPAGYMPLRGDSAQVAVTLDFSQYEPIKRLTAIRWKVCVVADLHGSSAGARLS